MAAMNKPQANSNNMDTIWQPQPGSQMAFLSCPYFEVLYEGTRGPGKTDSLIMDFLQHVNVGFGPTWRGILFRQSFPQLADIITKTKKWFWRIFPQAKYNASNYTWHFPAGEQLLLRYINSPDDYWNYHGHEYPWMGFEELTNWATKDCYESMISCCRSSDPGMPRKIRATANPYGKGHNWVKTRFIDPAPPLMPVRDENNRVRVRIHGSIHENKVLLKEDPDYLLNLKSITDQNKKKAWLEGDWDIVAGGAIDDVWSRYVHVVEPFKIPVNWRIDRSFDWGSSKPFSVGWWAEANGEEVALKNGTKWAPPKGTLFRIMEYYGWNGNPNEGCKKLAVDIAKDILAIEKKAGLKNVKPGPADSSIFAAENGVCIADDMQKVGVRWLAADKSRGSRVNGLEAVRKLLKAATARPMEEPGLFVFNTCQHFIRTVPVLPRDEKNPDDVDTDTEDHVFDEVRYRCMNVKRKMSVQQVSLH